MGRPAGPPGDTDRVNVSMKRTTRDRYSDAAPLLGLDYTTRAFDVGADLIREFGQTPIGARLVITRTGEQDFDCVVEEDA